MLKDGAAPGGPSVEIFDTTLRDGAQGEGMSFSIQDKLAICTALDELGVAWVEAGNPGSNPKDKDFFRRVKKLRLENARLCAFGSTRKKGAKAGEDEQLASLLSAETEFVVVFGKASTLHVREVLKASLDENLAMIAETLEFLRREGRTVFFDAEHFFDGLAQNRDYALKSVRTAAEAGAARIILCDTNGGSFPGAVTEGTLAAARCLEGLRGCGAALGIHAHNDSGLALACSIAALDAGASHVQGTLLGFGERCGNTCLAALIPSLERKMGLRCLPDGKLSRLTDISRRVAEIANCTVGDDMPYIGAHAFSHKAGMHADAILKVSSSFEHIDPALVGNGRRFLMSEQGGRAAIAERVGGLARGVSKAHPAIGAISRRLKALEAGGWAFDGADASFEMLVCRELGLYKGFFDIIAFRVQSEHPAGKLMECCHAWVKVFVKGQYEIAAAEGDGPVNALDGALRRGLLRFYPELAKMRLSDYKVRVIDGKEATAAKVRVLIESTAGGAGWTTVGVSADIIDASRLALVDSIEYYLTQTEKGSSGRGMPLGTSSLSESK
ncbi:MAG: citramalate synthase [Spirochaetaceae bacterium]|jgi:2-isopropylmalate synthase|nr:citramalate synthase [Spirochaetaceae bacterium]